MLEGNTSLKAPRTLGKEEWPPNYDEVYAWRAAQLARYETDPKYLENAKAFYADGVRGCIAFINHWCDTFDTRETGFGKLPTGKSAGAWMPFILFKRQEELVVFILECMADDAPGLVEKCRTMGASWICVAISVWLWLFHPGTSIGWGSQKAENVDEIGNPKSVFWKIRMLIERLPKVFVPQNLSDSDIKLMLCHNPENESTIAGEVGDNIGRGGRTRVFFKDESAHYEHPDLIESALSENTRVPIDISSVNGLGNLFHRKREAGIDWYPGKQIEKGYIRVFVMDSYDHPEYDEEWHRQKKQHHIRQGTPHIYAQEIERNYAASVQGVIIPSEWLDACIDAHTKLGIPVDGPKSSALDIGDSEDGDRNAQVDRTGIVLTYAEEWVAKDPGVTARKAMAHCLEARIKELQYDAAGGLGSHVKAQANMLKQQYPDADKNPLRDLQLVPWNAGGKVLHPGRKVNEDDDESPLNKNFYMNLKAQGWWELRGRCYRTYQAVVGVPEYEGGPLVKVDHHPDTLLSIPSTLPLLQKIKKELCQPVMTKGARLKLVVDKAPEGTKSPNLGDCVMMVFWPLPAMTGEFTDIGLMPSVFLDGEVFKGP
jgi:hypothetical protein